MFLCKISCIEIFLIIDENNIIMEDKNRLKVIDIANVLVVDLPVLTRDV